MEYFGDLEFQRYKYLIYKNLGIHFSDTKRELLHSKIIKCMKKLQIQSYDELYQLLSSIQGKNALLQFANEITTNKTDFFRESHHFAFLQNQMKFIASKNERILRNNEIRVWSAGCSTGEEAYTLAMILKGCFKQDIKIKILATDISSKVISKGMQACYSTAIEKDIPKAYLLKYFHRIGETFEVCEEIKKNVTFRLFNLMDVFPFKNQFDIIFCRNVMIYFDNNVQQKLVQKFYDVMVPGGLLFIGHSESLANKHHQYRYVQPTIYMK